MRVHLSLPGRPASPLLPPPPTPHFLSRGTSPYCLHVLPQAMIVVDQVRTVRTGDRIHCMERFFVCAGLWKRLASIIMPEFEAPHALALSRCSLAIWEPLSWALQRWPQRTTTSCGSSSWALPPRWIPSGAMHTVQGTTGAVRPWHRL